MIESMEDLKRREAAITAAEEIMKHPAYPFDDPFPRAMIVIIDRAMKAWEGRPK